MTSRGVLRLFTPLPSPRTLFHALSQIDETPPAILRHVLSTLPPFSQFFKNNYKDLFRIALHSMHYGNQTYMDA